MSFASPPDPVKKNKPDACRKAVNTSTIATYGSAYCVIDTDNLFVGTTLEDELLLLGADESVLADIREDCARLGLQVDAGRKLATYSGGEQAIIGCLTLMRLLPREPLRILLVHVLETLSPRNRELLLRRFDSVLPAARLFTLEAGAPREANRDA
jgi:hypothetical protein